MNIPLWIDQEKYELSLEERGENFFEVSLGKKKFLVSAEFLSEQELLLKINDNIFNIMIRSNLTTHSVMVKGKEYHIEKKSLLRVLKEERGKARKREVKTTMPGRIVRVMANEGDLVRVEQPVLVLEAMKMQNEIKSPQAGKIMKIHYQAGDYVEAGSVLFSVE